MVRLKETRQVAKKYSNNKISSPNYPTKDTTYWGQTHK